MSLPHRRKGCRFEVILLVPALLAFAGCMVGPNYHRPKATVSANWLESGDPRVSGESATYREWWRAFDDPVLDRLIERAYRENLTLQGAGVRVLQARAQLGIAIGEIYPQTQQAFGSVQYNRTSERAATGAAFQGSFNYWQAQIGAQASWEPDFWGKFRRGIESADATLLSTLAAYDSTLVTLTADVANSYITIRTAEERIRIARENVKTQEESLKIAEARFKYGTVTQLDVEQARTVLLNTLASIPTLETQRRQARDALSVLLGMPPSEMVDLLTGPSGIPVSPRQVIVGIPADLLRRRPDIRNAELQAAAQSAQIGVAKAELFPSLTLVGNVSLLATNLGTFKLSDMWRWAAARSRSVRLFSGTSSTMVRSRTMSARRTRTFSSCSSRIRMRCSRPSRTWRTTWWRSSRRRNALISWPRASPPARTALRVAMLQYREGVVDFTTVLTAQQTLLSQQDSLASTLGTIATSLVGVYRALGGGWEVREGQDLIPPEIKAEMRQRTNWGQLLAPSTYNLPASREPESAPRLPNW